MRIPCCFFRLVFLCCLVLVSGVSGTRAADWQWSVEIPSVTSTENNGHPRAFLWVPPGCQRLRGVVVGQHNMEEQPIFEHPKFRETLAELGFGEIWVSPGWDLFFRFDQGSADKFSEMMMLLAEKSGYAELTKVPVVPIGHSAAASYPWNFAALWPERTLAVISVSGQWPYYVDKNTPDWGGRNVDGVPGLVSMGEYEAAESRAGVGLGQRTDHPQTALSMFAEPGAGHFDVSDAKVEYLSFYLKKAVEHRYPAETRDGPIKLKPVNPAKEGWLADRWHRDKGPDAPAAPVGSYGGDSKNAFWYFDKEHADFTEQMQARYRGKKPQLVGLKQEGVIVPFDPKKHEGVTLKFIPVEDGLSFKIEGDFLDSVPAGGPEKWTGLPEGSSIAHASGGGPVVISRICGSVEQTGPDTWAIRYDRSGLYNMKRSHDCWLLASHPGDDEYRRAVQQSHLRFWDKNKNGADQKITFAKIADQKVGGAPVKLVATSDAGLPVHFFVREGPAEIEGDTLKFTQIPPRAQFPVEVTVVAWQWGRSIDPKVKTADPVTQTFLIKQ